MKHASFFADFPKDTAPADERTRKASSEADPHVRGFETGNRDWLVHYSDAYKDSDDADNDKIGTTSANLEVRREKDRPIIHFPHFREWRRGHFFPSGNGRDWWNRYLRQVLPQDSETWP